MKYLGLAFAVISALGISMPAHADSVLDYTIGGSLYHTNTSQTPDGISSFTGTVDIDTSIGGLLITSASILFTDGIDSVFMNTLPSGGYSGITAPGTGSQYSISQLITDGGNQSFYLVLGELTPGDPAGGFDLCVDPTGAPSANVPATCNGESRYTGQSQFNAVGSGSLTLVTPEPPSFLLLGTGMLGLAGLAGLRLRRA